MGTTRLTTWEGDRLYHGYDASLLFAVDAIAASGDRLSAQRPFAGTDL